jgi:hypothetical protein
MYLGVQYPDSICIRPEKKKVSVSENSSRFDTRIRYPFRVPVPFSSLSQPSDRRSDGLSLMKRDGVSVPNLTRPLKI